VDGDDVIVLNGGGRLGFAQESLACIFRRRQARQHDLECHGALELGVLGGEDGAHVARAEHAQDAVASEPPELPCLHGRSQRGLPQVRRG